MGKSAPPSPDYTGAANAQGAASMWNTAFQTYANRPDIYTPFGSMTWDRPSFQNPYAASGSSGGGGGGYGAASGSGGGPGLLGAAQSAAGAMNPFGGGGGGGAFGAFTPGMLGPGGGGGGGGYGAGAGFGTGGSNAPNLNMDPAQTWGMHINLSPEQQAAVEAQQRIQAGRSGLAENALGNVGQNFSRPFDFSGVPGLVNGEDARTSAINATYGQAASRLDPQWNQRRDQLVNDLANQGAMPGSPMYEREMQNFERARNDAYTSAMNSATQYGEQAASGAFGRSLTGHQQGISDVLTQREQPFNEMQALLGGAQVGMPQMPGFTPAGAASAPNYLGAAQAGYGSALNSFNAGQAQLQGLMGGATNLAMLGLMF